MRKKTLAYVVYPGISLLELVANRTLLGGMMAHGTPLKFQAGYEVVVVGERIEEMATDTPMAIIPQKTLADVPQPDALVVIGGGAETLPALVVNDLKVPSKMVSLTSLADRNVPLSHSLRREQREGGRARDKREELGSHLLLWGQLDTIAQGF